MDYICFRMNFHFSMLALSLILSLLSVACDRNDNVNYVLEDIASYIEQEPQKALSALQRIESSQLRANNIKAKHSLLLSMAMDKNYIDKTDFSVLQPAINYYESHGSPEEKMTMYYYKGRIYDNAGNQELAMASYVEGIEAGNKADEYPVKARLYFAKGLIHKDLYEYKKYVESMQYAAECYDACNNIQSYLSSIDNIVNGYTLLRDTVLAMKWLEIMKERTDSNDTRSYSEYYEARTGVISVFGTHKEKMDAIDEYIHKIQHKNIRWLTVANSYLKSGQFKEGLEAVRNHEKYSKTKSARYYAILSELHEKLGNTKDALNNYRKYIRLSDSSDMVLFRNNTKFMEEKHNLELRNEKTLAQKKIILVCAICVVIVLALLILWATKLVKIKVLEKEIAQKESERYKMLYDNLLDEKNCFLEMSSVNSEITEQANNAIMNRMNILNDFFKAHVSDDCQLQTSAINEMEKIFENRYEFLRDTKLIFTASYPHFIAKLKECNMTETEIMYCCMYAIGLKGSHIGKYLGTSNIYNISSSIRRKLGLDEYKKNIDKHIRELLQK